MLVVMGEDEEGWGVKEAKKGRGNGYCTDRNQTSAWWTRKPLSAPFDIKPSWSKTSVKDYCSSRTAHPQTNKPQFSKSNESSRWDEEHLHLSGKAWLPISMTARILNGHYELAGTASRQHIVMLCSISCSQNSGAVWKSRWTSWAPVLNKPTVSVDVKQYFNHQSLLFSRCRRRQ